MNNKPVWIAARVAHGVRWGDRLNGDWITLAQGEAVDGTEYTLYVRKDMHDDRIEQLEDQLAAANAHHDESIAAQCATNGELKAELDRTRTHLSVALRALNEKDAQLAVLHQDATRYRRLLYRREGMYKNPV